MYLHCTARDHWNSLSGNWCYHCCHEYHFRWQVAKYIHCLMSSLSIIIYIPRFTLPHFQALQVKKKQLPEKHWHCTRQKEKMVSQKVYCTLSVATIGFSFSDDKRDEPHITEEVLYNCIGCSRGFVNLHILQSPLREHSDIFRDIRIDTGMTRMRLGHHKHEAQFMLYRLENGFQIFYRCLRETQNVCSGHRILADDLERKGKSVCIIQKISAVPTQAHIAGEIS